MASFLLIHGAWHGAWAFERLIPALRSMGHEARAIDLPGHGDDPTPVREVTHEAYVQRILSEARKGDVLVGHSLAGVSTTDAADREPELFRQVIYICAFVPRDGQSLRDISKAGGPRPLDAALIPSDDRTHMLLDTSIIGDIFYTDVSEDDRQAAIARFRPQSTDPQTHRLSLSGTIDRVRRDYILCERDNTIAPALQASMVADWPDANVHRLDAGHSPFYTHVQQLAALLDRIAS